jgi:hypothetical protein
LVVETNNMSAKTLELWPRFLASSFLAKEEVAVPSETGMCF